ncbi:endonuclease, partial [Listeria innocua]|nr:endonuclease [Listeria innocua]
MIIHELIILDFENEKANKFTFSAGVNIITSDKTTTGKSSLIKSLFYTLGFEIKQFPHGWNFMTMRFRLN